MAALSQSTLPVVYNIHLHGQAIYSTNDAGLLCRVLAHPLLSSALHLGLQLGRPTEAPQWLAAIFAHCEFQFW